jgi:hypothetical protein
MQYRFGNRNAGSLFVDLSSNNNNNNNNNNNTISIKQQLHFIKYIICILIVIFCSSIYLFKYIHNKHQNIALEKTTIIFREKLLDFITLMEEDKIKLNISIHKQKYDRNDNGDDISDTSNTINDNSDDSDDDDNDDADYIAKIKFYNLLNTQIKIFREVYDNNNETYTILNILTIEFAKNTYKIEILKHLQNDLIYNGYISITKLSNMMIEKLQYIINKYPKNICLKKDEFICRPYENVNAYNNSI